MKKASLVGEIIPSDGHFSYPYWTVDYLRNKRSRSQTIMLTTLARPGRDSYGPCEALLRKTAAHQEDESTSFSLNLCF